MIKQNIKIWVLIFLSTVFYFSCQKDKTPLSVNDKPEMQWVVDTTMIHEMVAQVDSNRIWQNMLHLTSYPGRDNFEEIIDEVREWIADYVSNTGLVIEVHRYLGFKFDFYFSSIKNGIAFAHPDFNLHTNDGGLSWKKLSLPTSPEFQFFGENYGYLSSGENQKFEFTNDGGRTWATRNNSFGVRFMYFLNKNEGWGIDVSELYHTFDGGNSWLEVNNFQQFIWDMFFWDSLNAIISSDEMMFKTSDKWNSWIEIHNVPTGVDLLFVDADKGFMKSREYFYTDSLYYETSDGGITWTNSNNINTKLINDLYFIRPNHLWGIGKGNVWYSSDMGTSWSIKSTYKGSNGSLFFADSLNGWLYTSKGIFNTIDGGKTWKDYSLNLPEKITWENIIVTIPGKINPDEEIILCGHYDTVNQSPGADDNASGVCTLLEFVSVLSKYDFAKTIKIIFFSGEEVGLIGSKRYVELAVERGENISAVLNFDVIGYWKAGLPRDLNIIHNSNSSTLADSMICAIYMFSKTEVVKNNPIMESDHSAFWLEGYPAVWFSEGGSYIEFNPYNNSAADIIDHINRSFLNGNIKAGLVSAAYLAKPVIKNIKKK